MKSSMNGTARKRIHRSVAVVSTTVMAIGGFVARPVVAAPAANSLTSCSFSEDSLTVSEADPSAQTIMTYAGTPDGSAQVFGWLVVTIDGVEGSSGINPFFTDEFPSPWTRTYNWSLERDGTVRKWTWYVLSDQNALEGSPLCSITVCYGSNCGADGGIDLDIDLDHYLRRAIENASSLPDTL